jgi:hypothetical protein
VESHGRRRHPLGSRINSRSLSFTYFEASHKEHFFNHHSRPWNSTLMMGSSTSISSNNLWASNAVSHVRVLCILAQDKDHIRSTTKPATAAQCRSDERDTTRRAAGGQLAHLWGVAAWGWVKETRWDGRHEVSLFTCVGVEWRPKAAAASTAASQGRERATGAGGSSWCGHRGRRPGTSSAIGEREEGTSRETETRREVRARDRSGSIEDEWGAKNPLELPRNFAVSAGAMGSFWERA